MFASLTVLPAVLAWLGDRVEKGRIPFLGRRRRAGESRFWSAIVDRVMRRPWLSIVLAGGSLVALAIPALNMKIVVTSVDDLPQDLPVIQTYNRLKDAFPKEGVTVDVAVKADDVRDGQTQAGIDLASSASAEISDAVLGEHGGHLQQGRHRRPGLDPDGRQRQRRRVDGGAERDPRRR